MLKGNHIFLKDGDLIEIKDNDWYEVCCDCGLVHHIQVIRKKGKIFLKQEIDKVKTLKTRKYYGIAVKKPSKEK